jgi:nitrite reductase (NO-forming)
MKTTHPSTIFLTVLIAMFLFACAPQNDTQVPVTPVEDQPATPVTIDAEFTLQTIAENGKLLYIGMGGDIDGIVNPDLIVQPGAVVRIILIDGDGMTHDLFLPDFNAKTEYVKKIGDQSEIVFQVGDMQPGSYVYYCTLPGHRKAGQEGKLIVTAKP